MSEKLTVGDRVIMKSCDFISNKDVRRLLKDVEAAEAENARFRTALNDLCAAEQHYRSEHDIHGGKSLKSGRAWDLMRRAGNDGRAALDPTTPEGVKPDRREGKEHVTATYGERVFFHHMGLDRRKEPTPEPKCTCEGLELKEGFVFESNKCPVHNVPRPERRKWHRRKLPAPSTPGKRSQSYSDRRKEPAK